MSFGEAIGQWTTEVNAWVVLMIFFTLIGAAFAGYGAGIAEGVHQVDEHLNDLGIVSDPAENLITIYEPAEDKVFAKITWDDQAVVLTPFDLDDQEWSSEST